MMKKEELLASELLLDLGVAIPLRPLRFFSKKKPRRISLRRPYMGGLIRISQIYLKIGVSREEIENYTPDEMLAFIAKHGKDISRLVACSIARGWLSQKLLLGVVAWYLRWRVHPIFLTEAMIQLNRSNDLSPFKNIISSAERMNLLKPRLSH